MMATSQADQDNTQGSTYHLRALATAQFIAAVMIMIRHYMYFTKDTYPLLSNIAGNINFVEFFFSSSGFLLVIAYRYKVSSIKLFITKRLSRIYPLHVVTALFFVMIIIARKLGLFSPKSSGIDNISDLMYHITLTHSWGFLGRNSLNYPSWYLSAQFAAYLIFLPALNLLKQGHAWLLAVAMIVSFILLELVSERSSAGHWTNWTYHFGVARAVPTFLSGMLLGWYFNTFSRKITSFVPAYFAFSLSMIGMMTGYFLTISYVILQIALVPLLAAPEVNAKNSFLMSRYAIFLAPLSFPLFLIHVPVATIVINFMFHNLTSGKLIGLLVVLTMIIAVGAAAVVHFVLESWHPLDRFWRRPLVKQS